MPRTAPTEWDAEHAYYVMDEPILLYTWSDGVSRSVYSDFNQTQVVASFTYPEDDCTDIQWIVDYDNACAHAIGIYNGQYVTWNQAMAFCAHPGPYDR